jgi:hypothetical protein
MISFDLPLRTYSALNMREHWARRARRVKIERGTAYLLTPTGLKLPLVIRLVRIAPRPLDGHDNLASSMKGVVDGIADRLGIKDNSPDVHWHYAQARGKPKEYSVRVECTQR